MRRWILIGFFVCWPNPHAASERHTVLGIDRMDIKTVQRWRTPDGSDLIDVRLTPRGLGKLREMVGAEGRDVIRFTTDGPAAPQ